MVVRHTNFIVQKTYENSQVERWITPDHFGGIYTGYRNFDRYADAHEQIGLTSVRWPGGAAAEKVSWYGLEYENLVDPARNKPGLSEMCAYSFANELPLTIIIPTAEYANDLKKAHADFRKLLDRMATGKSGELPETVIYEIGNEYYATKAFQSNPTAYGRVANVLAETMAEYLDSHTDAFENVDVCLTVQIGKTPSDNAAIISQINSNAINAIDTLVFHRFAWGLDDGDNVAAKTKRLIEDWTDAGVTDAAKIYFSGWNVASWTRKDALERFKELKFSKFGEIVDNDAIDLATRNAEDFELFWQTGELRSEIGSSVFTKWGLANRNYGLAQASAMMEILSSHVGIGVDMANLYGLDVPYPGHVSFGDYMFVGGAMLQMMSETLPGTQVIETGAINLRDNEVNVHAFEGHKKVVLYVSADQFEIGVNQWTASIDISTLGNSFSSITSRHLTSKLDPDWMNTFNVPDNVGIDEFSESRIYEEGVISIEPVEVRNGIVDLSFSHSFEVVELVLTIAPAEGLGTGNGANILVGALGDDEITGDTSEDILIGGDGGLDFLTGGEGNDIFVFREKDEPDYVTDFRPGEDKIDLTAFTQDAAILELDFGEWHVTQIGCYGGPTITDKCTISFVQQGEDVSVISVDSFSWGDAIRLHEIAVLEGTDINDILIDDVLF